MSINNGINIKFVDAQGQAINTKMVKVPMNFLPRMGEHVRIIVFDEWRVFPVLAVVHTPQEGQIVVQLKVDATTEEKG